MTCFKLGCALLVGVSAPACLFVPPHNRPFELTTRVDTRAVGLVAPPAGPALIGAPIHGNRFVAGGTISTHQVTPRALTRDDGASGNSVATVSGGGYVAARLQDSGFEVGAALEFASGQSARSTFADVAAVAPTTRHDFNSGRGWIFSRASFGERFGGGLSVALGAAGVDSIAVTDYQQTTRFLDTGQVMGDASRVERRYHAWAFDGAFGGQMFYRPWSWVALSGGASLVLTPSMIGRRQGEASCRGVGFHEEVACANSTNLELSLPSRFEPAPDVAVTFTPWLALDVSMVWVTLSGQFFVNALSSRDLGASVPYGAQLALRIEFEYAQWRARRAESPRPSAPAALEPPAESSRAARTL